MDKPTTPLQGQLKPSQGSHPHSLPGILPGDISMDTTPQMMSYQHHPCLFASPSSKRDHLLSKTIHWVLTSSPGAPPAPPNPCYLHGCGRYPSWRGGGPWERDLDPGSSPIPSAGVTAGTFLEQIPQECCTHHRDPSAPPPRGFWDSALEAWLMAEQKLISPGSGCFFLFSQSGLLVEKNIQKHNYLSFSSPTLHRTDIKITPQ